MTLDPPLSLRAHGYLVHPPARSRARLPASSRAGGSHRGGQAGHRPLHWTGYLKKRWSKCSRYIGSAGGSRSASRSAQCDQTSGQAVTPSGTLGAQPPCGGDGGVGEAGQAPHVVGEPGALLDPPRRTLSRWLHEGIGPPSIKLASGARRYRKADLDCWIAEHQADE